MSETPSDYHNPDWGHRYKCHEWKNYISKEIQEMWSEFTDAQQRALARQAEENASNEEWD